MNERIKQLAHEARLLSEEVPEWMYDEGDKEKIQKFAELIVAECATLVDTTDSSKPYTTFGEKLKAHFGVEE